MTRENKNTKHSKTKQSNQEEIMLTHLTTGKFGNNHILAEDTHLYISNDQPKIKQYIKLRTSHHFDNMVDSFLKTVTCGKDLKEIYDYEAAITQRGKANTNIIDLTN